MVSAKIRQQICLRAPLEKDSGGEVFAVRIPVVGCLSFILSMITIIIIHFINVFNYEKMSSGSEAGPWFFRTLPRRCREAGRVASYKDKDIEQKEYKGVTIMTQEFKAACRGCHGGCIHILTVEDGKVTRVRPDPEGPLNNGHACTKGITIIEQMYHPDRLLHPLKRIGERGSGKSRRSGGRRRRRGRQGGSGGRRGNRGSGSGQGVSA